MRTQPIRNRIIAPLLGVVIFAVTGWALADPPTRVARMGYATGAVSFSPAGEDEWVQATINRPLTTGDRLWADRAARAELQVGGGVIRLGESTSVTLLNLDDNIAQVQLAQGTLNVRVRQMGPRQLFEVDTPNLAFTLRRPGEYRIEVDPDGDATSVFVRSGQGEVYGEGGASYIVDSRQPMRFFGTGLDDYEYVDAPRPDEFDRWARERDRRRDNSASARYVSRDVIGYEDLDANGTWRNDPGYGNVWTPNRVAAGWSPYQDGHWAWVDPWGWTWVDDAPWGFAVSHYGRWANLSGRWGWIPGPVRSQAVYAPALVAFVGGSNFQIQISSGNVGGVAWFPLGPRDVYRPAYPVSRRYFNNVNTSNTVINNTTITNVYNNTNVTNIVYVNQRVQGAVIAVPATAFVQSQRVSRVAVRVANETIVRAPVSAAAVVAPVRQSVHGAAAPGGKPPDRAHERPIVARTRPPAAPVGFASQERQLAAKPGTPLAEAARKELRPAEIVPAPKVSVVTPAKAAPPTALPPPPPASGGRVRDARGRSVERTAPAAPTVSGAPVASPQQRERPEQRGRPEQREKPVAAPPAPSAPAQVAPPQAVTPAPVAQPPQQRERPEQRGRPEQREKPAAAPVVPPQAVTPAPVAQPSQQRERPEQRGRPEQREKPVATPPAPPAAAPVAPPQAVTPAPVAQPPQQRERPEQRGRPEQREKPVATPPAPPAAAPVAPPQSVAPAPVAQPPQQRERPEQRGRPEQREKPAAAPPAPPAAAPVAPPQAVAPAPVAQPPQPSAEQRGQKPRPDARKKDDRKMTEEEQKREEELLKSKK